MQEFCPYVFSWLKMCNQILSDSQEPVQMLHFSSSDVIFVRLYSFKGLTDHHVVVVVILALHCKAQAALQVYRKVINYDI